MTNFFFFLLHAGLSYFGDKSSKGFMGKRKSERWKSSERRRTKQKISSDNLKDKTTETTYPKNNSKKQLNRRKKSKN